MIISDSFSNEYLSKINQILFDDSNRPSIRIIKRSHFLSDKEIYTEMYENSFLDFPVNYVKSSDEIIIYSDFVYNYEFYYSMQHEPALSTDKVIKEAEAKLNSDMRYDVYDYIQERIHNLVYNFKRSIILGRENYYFDCLDSNELIIKNLVNHYSNVIASADKQLSFFPHLTLTKEISDLLTKAFIEYLTDKLQMFNPNICSLDNAMNKHEYHINSSIKIIWNGSQKELAELFIELQHKGWINNIAELGFKKTAKVICEAFDISNTKRKEDSDEISSLAQLLKGTLNPDDKTIREYHFNTESGYQRKFNEIKRNSLT